jgi:superfamily II DNA/RNA helicase
MDFKELKISQPIIDGLKKEKITTPTKVQEAVIPKMMEQKDLIVQSETGSGKTLAYLLPMFEQLQPVEKGMKVLVLVPTHELAMQVHKQVERLAKNSGIEVTSATIFGDVNINRQIETLKGKQQIIIGTTGRILELIKKRKITAHTIKTIVLDEADKMLDKNNIEGVKAVMKCCMRDTQLILVSASMNKSTISVAETLVKNPEIIRTSDTLVIPKNIEHIYLLVERREKIEYLRKLAKSIKPKKAMVFINKVADIEEATQKLQYHHYRAECIHGSNVKQDRKKVMDDFKSGKLQFLIATDIAARGIHVEGVSTVFHISIPEDPMDYLHRAGRAGRGQDKGLSILLVTKEELARVKSYQKAFGINIIQKKMYQGKVVGK